MSKIRKYLQRLFCSHTYSKHHDIIDQFRSPFYLCTKCGSWKDGKAPRDYDNV